MVVLPTAYFPNTKYCSVLNEHKEVTIDTGEHFIKQTIRNRCYVLGPNSELKLIVPLKKWKNNTSVKDLEISYSEDWQKIHWKTLESCYRSSPYFEYYEDKFDQIINQNKFKYLIDLNHVSLEMILSTLNLEVEITESKVFIEADESHTDLRKEFINKDSKYNSNQPYTQVFAKNEFFANLSFIDLICNEGPNAIHLL